MIPSRNKQHFPDINRLVLFRNFALEVSVTIITFLPNPFHIYKFR
jgi:hypothetical protein